MEKAQYLLQNIYPELRVDCRFLVGISSNQREFYGHRWLLAMESTVFELMFYGSVAERSDPIIIPDVQPNAFKAMLKYIYTGIITIPSFDIGCELYYLALKYMLPHLPAYCSVFLRVYLTQKNACCAYECGKLFDDQRLIESSMKYIAANTLEVIADPSFMDIKFSTLMDILDQNRLNIRSEMDLFNCLLQFANEYDILNDSGSKNASDSLVEEIKLEPDNSNSGAGTCGSVPNVADEVVVVDSDASASENASELAAYAITMNEADLRQAVKMIRFLTMTPEQFAEGPACSKLLQQNEAFAILLKLKDPENNDFPMPEGFSQSGERFRANDNHLEERWKTYDFSALLDPQMSFIVNESIYLLGVRINFVYIHNLDNISVCIIDQLHSEIARTSSVQVNNNLMFEFTFDNPVFIQRYKDYYFKISKNPDSRCVITLSPWDRKIVCNGVKFRFSTKFRPATDSISYSAINEIAFAKLN